MTQLSTAAMEKFSFHDRSSDRKYKVAQNSATECATNETKNAEKSPSRGLSSSTLVGDQLSVVTMEKFFNLFLVAVFTRHTRKTSKKPFSGKNRNF